MRKLFFVLLSFILASVSYAQNVTVSGALTGNGNYATLGAAFTAINGGAQTGAIISISISGNTTEAASAVLNEGAWNTLTITPTGGGTRIVSGDIAGPLIDLNGADRVTINGAANGTLLTLTNISTSNISNTSTMR
ncbi:MAG: hypothetical protein ACO25B_13925, partial [Chitinophagaceae bacterium]